MKKYLLPLLTLIIASVLAYSYSIASFFLLAVATLSFAVLLITALIKAFKKSLNPKWLTVPLMLVAICFVAAAIGMARPFEAPVINSSSVSDTLAYAYETDQGDRKTLKSYLSMFREQVQLRDSLRLEQVKQLYNSQQITRPLDKFHAAFILHHSKESELYKIAHKLATEAAAANEMKSVIQAQWLAKASYDRWMLSTGQPQKYDTQDSFSVSVK